MRLLEAQDHCTSVADDDVCHRSPPPRLLPEDSADSRGRSPAPTRTSDWFSRRMPNSPECAGKSHHWADRVADPRDVQAAARNAMGDVLRYPDNPVRGSADRRWSLRVRSSPGSQGSAGGAEWNARGVDPRISAVVSVRARSLVRSGTRRNVENTGPSAARRFRSWVQARNVIHLGDATARSAVTISDRGSTESRRPPDWRSEWAMPR